MDSIRLNQATPARGDTVTFTVHLDHRPKGDIVLVVTAFQNQVLVYEQRGALNDAYTLEWEAGAATGVANVYDIVHGDYMAKAVTVFDVTG